jgi:membrane associated rhomboid family serine protease
MMAEEVEAEPESEPGAESVRGFEGAPVTGALFVTNSAVFAAQIWLAGDWRYLGTGVPDGLLRKLGANASLWTIADTRLETLVTSLFLHASLVHLAVNLFILYQVGRQLEAWIGSARFFTLYLASGIAASASSAIWGRIFGQTLSVGASGAICGLIAAGLVGTVRTDGLKSKGALRMAFLFAVLVVTPIVARYLHRDTVQTDNAAHVGGALAGVVIALIWRLDVDYGTRGTNLVVGACMALVALSGAVLWLRNSSDPYLFLDLRQRVEAARDAFYDGRCEEARDAMRRAIAMDPRNFNLQQDSTRIDLQCADAWGDERARPLPSGSADHGRR